MLSLKKLVFPPIFLVSFFILISQISSIFKSLDIIFSFSVENIIQLVIISLLLMFSSFLYALFTGLSNDWRINLAVGTLSVLIPFLFLEISLAIIFGVLLSISLTLSCFNLRSALTSYLNFSPNSIFGPSIRHLTTLLIISISIVYFLSINKIITEKGFQIPDSLIDASLKFTPIKQDKQNPDLLKQYGIDPKILDSLGTESLDSNFSAKDLVRKTVKDQFENILKPYQSFISPFLAVLLFFTLQAFTALVNLLIYPLLWITFYFFEKTNFIKFTIEMRPVKKMVI